MCIPCGPGLEISPVGIRLRVCVIEETRLATLTGFDTPSPSHSMHNLVSPVWKSEPEFRGTFGILSTCLSTLIICVWSAVHVDIPPQQNTVRGVLRRLGWLLAGLLAPDLLLFNAFSQWYHASRLHIDVSELLGSSPSRMGSILRVGSALRRKYSKVCDSRLCATTPKRSDLFNLGILCRGRWPQRDYCGIRRI